MGRTCCVIGCRSRSHDHKERKIDNGLSFYGFPSWKKLQGSLVADITKRRRTAWLAAISRSDIKFANIPRYMKVCSRHFHSGKPAYEMDESHPDWAPSLHLGHSNGRVTLPDRYLRRQKRHGKCTGRKERAYIHMAEDKGEGDNAEVEAAEEDRDGDNAEVEEEEVHRVRVKVEAAEEEEHGVRVKVEAAEDERDGDNAEVEAAEEEEHGDGAEVEAAEDGAGVAEEDSHEPAAKKQRTDCQNCVQSRTEINRLLQENRKLRSELSKRQMDEEFFKGSTDKVRYYTGLPCFAILFSMFNIVKPFLPVSNTFSPFQMIVLTLIRLRLDLPLQHLSHLFNVSRKTLSTVFTDTIDVLHARLNPLVQWPERQRLQATMPHEFFEAFGQHVAIIVDCFEILTERPSSMKVRKSTFSHDKNTHSVKYLIGITPQGAVSFISKGWEGRASDKHITENCGLLDKLLPGDVVLADRGFDIKNSEGMMCAEVKTPALTGGRCRLDIQDVENTQAVTHLRIHVERVIGSMRNKYTILHNRMPVSLLLPCEAEEVTLLDKIVAVCCTVVNMCPSVVVK